MGGGLSKTPAPVLGSIVIEEALKRAGVPKEEVDHVYMGCVIQAGLGQNVARQASIGCCWWYGEYVYGTICYDAGAFRIPYEQR